MQTLSADQLVGSVLGGEYTVEQFLGRGALTAAYIGQQHALSRRVLITIFLVPERFSDVMRERFKTRFLREGEALVGLQHPHLLPMYDCGEYTGSPYLVTAYTKDQSLARIVKDQPRFTVQQTVELLRQLADGLDYAHRTGVVHGSLSPATVLLDKQYNASIAGFGFVRMLAMQGVEDRNFPYAHLVNVANTFLGIPGYIAPESVQHPIIDARSDVYALGVMAFQLLSGTVPFSGSNPLEVALQRIQRPIPSLQEGAPDVSVALDLVVQRALEQDPARRFQSAGEFARAFESVLAVTQQATIASSVAVAETAFDSQITQPPTVNWLEGSGINASGKNAALSSKTDTGSWQLTPPIKTGKVAAVVASPSLDASVGDDVASIDPFVWWSTTEMSSVQVGQAAGTFTQKKTASLSARRKSAVQSRRRVIMLLAGGGVVAAGVLGVTGVSLAHLMHKAAPQALGGQQVATQGNTTTGSTHPTQGGPTKGVVQTTPVATKGHATTPTAGPQATPTAKPQATSATGAQATPTAGTQATPQPTPTQPPKPTPTPPPHTGTVIGSTSQGTNTAQSFTNPRDGQGSFLIHLPSGNFVAYEKACTHAGVGVYYDSGRQKLVCPAHGAVFDPASGGQAIQGPTNQPLPQVAIHVNADGTITVG